MGRPSFAASGWYAVEGALQRVHIDLAARTGEYFDPCLWMEHPVDDSGTPSIDPVGPDEIRAHLRQSLPDYMLPEHIRFLSAMPLTSSGKVDLQALKALDLSTERRPRRLAPESQLQARLVEIWRTVLRRDDVGVTDDFFQLGGHSIRALQMLARVSDVFQTRVALRDFFDEATVAGLERCIRRMGGGDDLSR